MQALLKEWVHRCEDKPIPVMAHTVERLRKYSSQEDTPLSEIVDAIEQDPGLTIQLFRVCNSKGKNKLQREVTSVQQALMLMGTRPAANMAMQLPLVTKSLAVPARLQLLRTFCRAYHAGMQAVTWAKHRRDMMPDEVFVATQLHFLGEMVLSMYAPDKLLEIFSIRKEKNIASEEAQYLVLGFTLDQLSRALVMAWGLPTLVVEALRAENAQQPRAYGVMLAVQLVRHAAIDWYQEKTLKLEHEAAEWLGKPADELTHECHQIAVQVAQASHYDGVLQTAELLMQLPSASMINTAEPVANQEKHTGICLVPQLNVIKDTLAQLQHAVKNNAEVDLIIKIATEGMHDGIGLNRVVFASTDKSDKFLHPRRVIGSENDPIFSRFHLELKTGTLLFHLLEKSQAICITDANRKSYWSLVPASMQKLIGTNSFMAMSIFVHGQVQGIIYADRHTSDCQIDNTSYQYFKKLCQATAQAIELVSKRSAKKTG